MLEIRKKSNKNFWHYYSGLEYSASDLVIDVLDSNVFFTKKNGAYIFLKKGFNVSDISVYDDTVGGSEETFLNVEDLFARLIELGYPAFINEGEISITSIDGNA